MTNPALVIGGLFLGLAGAITMMWTTITTTESEINERSSSYVNINPSEVKALRKERRFARLGGIIAFAGALTQTVGAFAF